MGYHRAGFTVLGTDIEEQPRYPFHFTKGDAMEVLRWMHFDDIDAIHASPPCQHYCAGTHDRDAHPDLIGEVRELLQMTGKPWVIENVPGAPMRADYILCGSAYNLGVRRHRLFETSWGGFDLEPPCDHTEPAVRVYGHTDNYGYKTERELAMGIDWMTTDELAEAIPPAYTERVGKELLAQL